MPLADLDRTQSIQTSSTYNSLHSVYSYKAVLGDKTTLDIEFEYLSTAELSTAPMSLPLSTGTINTTSFQQRHQRYGNSVFSDQPLSEDQEEEDEEGYITGELEDQENEDQQLRTRVMYDPFAMSYQPSFDLSLLTGTPSTGNSSIGNNNNNNNNNNTVGQRSLNPSMQGGQVDQQRQSLHQGQSQQLRLQHQHLHQQDIQHISQNHVLRHQAHNGTSSNGSSSTQQHQQLSSHHSHQHMRHQQQNRHHHQTPHLPRPLVIPQQQQQRPTSFVDPNAPPNLQPSNIPNRRESLYPAPAPSPHPRQQEQEQEQERRKSALLPPRPTIVTARPTEVGTGSAPKEGVSRSVGSYSLPTDATSNEFTLSTDGSELLDHGVGSAKPAQSEFPRQLHHQHTVDNQQYQASRSTSGTPSAQAVPPPLAARPNIKPKERSEHMIVSNDGVMHYTPELETKETLKRERTRILQRTVVSSYRTINYNDITEIQPMKRGGFGEIHTGEWSRLRVVLKRALVEHNEGVEQFEQELEILKRVHDYDFIVPFYGVTTDPTTGVKCMVMKHCTNGNLCTFLGKYHAILTWAERYRLSIEITKGLEFLHKSGFHHRDLHSGNILLDDKRTALICDFGLSRSATKAQTADLVAAVGVASFLAPERFPPKRPIYSASCDIYSLGVIFWHISSGRIPFGDRLKDPVLLSDLLYGLREEIVPGTPREYRDLLVKCWDIKPSRRLKIDVVIAVLQALMAKPSEPVHQVATGFVVPSLTKSAALPVPPELSAKMAALERATSRFNKMMFEVQDPAMKETAKYIERTRAFLVDQQRPEPYSFSNPPRTPVYLCPVVGDIAAFHYYLTQPQLHHGSNYNPINESSEQTGDTALHLACLFLEHPLDMIKVLVELGADINLENLQGYTPVMSLVTSNTQYCYESLKYFVMRGARIPAHIRQPIVPLSSSQAYALHLVHDSKPHQLQNGGAGVAGHKKSPHLQEKNILGQGQQQYQGRPLIHIATAMQEDYRILDLLCEAGLDPAIRYSSPLGSVHQHPRSQGNSGYHQGETALVVAAAHLKIKNVEWLLNHDLDISSSEADIIKAIRVVRVLYPLDIGSSSSPNSPTSSMVSVPPANSPEGEGLLSLIEEIRELGKFTWVGAAAGQLDIIPQQIRPNGSSPSHIQSYPAYQQQQRRREKSKDMVGPVLQLLEQWTGQRRIAARKEVATKLKLMYGSFPLTSSSQDEMGRSGQPQQVNGHSSLPRHHPLQQQYQLRNQQPNIRQGGGGGGGTGEPPTRKDQRQLIDQVLNDKSWFFKGSTS